MSSPDNTPQQPRFKVVQGDKNTPIELPQTPQQQEATSTPNIQSLLSSDSTHLPDTDLLPSEKYYEKRSLQRDGYAHRSDLAAQRYLVGDLDQPSSTSHRGLISSSSLASSNDNIPTRSLFIGRINERLPYDVEIARSLTMYQRDFFASLDYKDDYLTDAFRILAFSTLVCSFLTSPIERARALVQADTVSYSTLQRIPEGQSRNNVQGELLSQSEYWKGRSPGLHVPFDRPEPYHYHQQKILSLFDKEVENKLPNLSRLGKSEQLRQIQEIVNSNPLFKDYIKLEYANDRTLKYAEPKAVQTMPNIHRYYVEPELKTLRSALKYMYQGLGFKSFLYTQFLQALPRLSLLGTFFVFYYPWKIFTSAVSPDEKLNIIELKLAFSHTYTTVLPFILFYPYFAYTGHAQILKNHIYSPVPYDSMQWKQYTEQVRQWHTTNKSYRLMKADLSVSPLTGQVTKRQDLMQFEEAQRKDMVETLVKRAESINIVTYSNKFLARHFGGVGQYFRGMLPMTLGTLAYITTFAVVYSTFGPYMVKYIHQYRTRYNHNAVQNNTPPIKQYSSYDTKLEAIKAIVPLAISSTCAQYVAYPFTTIRMAMQAQGTPGYITLNPSHNVPWSYHVEQYKLSSLSKITPPPKISQQSQFHLIARYLRGGSNNTITNRGSNTGISALRGFYRGASIIPLVRVPQQILLGAILHTAYNSYWKYADTVIDSQHFYMQTPQL